MAELIIADKDLLSDSLKIYEDAAHQYPPKKIFAMVSGGSDSLTALHVALALDIPLDGIMHCVTGCGIKETSQFCRKVANELNLKYYEPNAGKDWEEYVLRKGFFGKGVHAHSFAYHICKHGPITKQIAKMRLYRRNYNILLLNGARILESANRKKNFTDPINIDSASKQTIWVNLIHNWSKHQCMQFLNDLNVKINPVTSLLHKSGDCYCGTMQTDEEREEASYWFPEFGRYLDEVEQHVFDHGFTWGWGENMPEGFKLSGKHHKFQPMCHHCSANEDVI